MALLHALTRLQVSRDDISADALYSPFVGAQYVTKEPLLILGRRSDNGPGIDYVLLVARPGISGPELAEYGLLSPGAKIAVRKVIRLDYLFEPTVEFDVTVSPSPGGLPDRPIYLRNLFGLYREQDGRTEPEPSRLERIR
jgi:hypothetical protein